jgi:hypothetical protein
MLSKFRRVFIQHEHLCVETAPGEEWALPNPTPEGKRYDPVRLRAAVIKAGSVDLSRWVDVKEIQE